MKNYGYVKVAAAIPSVKVADIDYNIEHIKSLVDRAVAEGVEIITFPELCITGYTCQDLFCNTFMLDKSDEALLDLTRYCMNLPIVVIVGAAIRQDNRLFNSAVVIAGGTYYTVNKTFLPNYNEFYEKRWFSAESAKHAPTIFELPSGVKFGIELCEDLWSPLPPSSYLGVSGADIIFNLSASDELAGKHQYIQKLLSQQSARIMVAYVYSSCGFGESSQDLVYGGKAFIYENGSQLSKSERFSLDDQLICAQIDIEHLRAERVNNTTFGRTQNMWIEKALVVPLDIETGSSFRFERTYNPHPFIPTGSNVKESFEEIFNIQVMGLAKRLIHTGCRNVVIGVSGGLDSTLALLVCIKAFDKLKLNRKGIHGITMPGFGTTDRTYTNAIRMMNSFGISQRDINISDVVTRHFSDIGHDINNHDVTYENSQARYRTMLLMDIANQVGGMVIGTGDLSELALGWCTYNGDQMSMYAVNVGIPKTLIKHLVRYIADNEVDEESRTMLLDVLDTPISPELIPADKDGNIVQKTEDAVGPYELHDFFLYYFIRYGFAPSKILLIAINTFNGINGPKYDASVIKKWLVTFVRRFFSQQFKRSCLPDGPKVGSVSLSPRGDWRMPSDATVRLWLDDCEKNS